MNWNRVHRPRKFSDLHLQSVRQYFLQLLKGSSFPQVFLFTGPKGTGKTSTARIIGATLNDPANADVVTTAFLKKGTTKQSFVEPSTDAPELESIFQGQSYLVQELDAASNRGIDDVRALKEQVQLPPVQGLISVYILDEVHMLTSEAFNALLKLLEEPPAHVVFILATTELQKVPETVISRCQVVQFSLASEAELLDSIQKVVDAEAVTLESDAVKFIAQQANGSFRDAVKLLEQAALLQLTSVATLEATLGAQYATLVPELVVAVLEKDARQILDILEKLRAQGVSEVGFHKDLIQYLHLQLHRATGVVSGTATVPFEASRFLLQELSSSEVSQPAPIPLLRLELKLLEILERALKKSKSTEGSPSAPPKKTTLKATTSSDSSLSPKESTKVVNETATTVVAHASEDLSGNGELLYQQWQSFVSQVAETNFSLATLLKSAQPLSGETGKITLGVYYKFHQEQLQQPKFTQQLNELISSTYGGSVHIDCVLNTQPHQAELAEPGATAQLEKLATEVLM